MLALWNGLGILAKIGVILAGWTTLALLGGLVIGQFFHHLEEDDQARMQEMNSRIEAFKAARESKRTSGVGV